MKRIRTAISQVVPATIMFAVMIFLSTFPARAQYGNTQYGGYDDFDQRGDYQVFYDDLAPYGQWLRDPQYGYVWAPNAGPNFRPYYTNGYWTMTNYGNMWVSNYEWGWAPFHYGRWTLSSYYGWVWIPGREWGPAWVTWREGGGYYGWAPMGPGISINVSFGSGYHVPNVWWTFIPYRNIYSTSFQRYYAPGRTVNIIGGTTIINNTYIDNSSRTTYVTGPRRSQVETTTRQKVPVRTVSNRDVRGATQTRGNNVEVYRPRINTVDAKRAANMAPRQVKVLDRSISGNDGQGRTVNERQGRNEGTRGGQRQESGQPQLQQSNRQQGQADIQRRQVEAQQQRANEQRDRANQQRQQMEAQQQRANEQRDRANQQRQQMEAQQQRANEQRDRANQQRQQMEAQQQRANEQRDRANQQRQQMDAQRQRANEQHDRANQQRQQTDLQHQQPQRTQREPGSSGRGR